MRRRIAFISAVTLGAVAASSAAAASAASGASASSGARASHWQLSSNFALSVGPSPRLVTQTQSSCKLSGASHVFYIGFDNFHLRRDNSNNVAANGDDNRNTNTGIPSDLEQVPALYNFLRGSSKAGTTPGSVSDPAGHYADGRSTTYADGTPFAGGTILANHHTPLISHTSVDFTTAYTGLYGDRHGVAVSQNSMGITKALPGQSTAADPPVGTQSGFAYWTDPISVSNSPDSSKVFTGPDGSGGNTNAPAPWVPFTRAGCDVGAVAATGYVLENSNSVATANAAYNAAHGTQSPAHYAASDEGIAVHCAQGAAADATKPSFCDAASTAVADNLPNEPGGYTGYKAMFGHRDIATTINSKLSANGDPAASSTPTTLNLLRTPAATGFDSSFNGDDGNFTLGYDLAMQKAGIPVTVGYLTSAHNCYNSLFAGSTTTPDDYNAKPSSGTGSAYTDAPPNASANSGNGRCNTTNVSGTSTPSGSLAFGSGEQGYVNYLKNLNDDFTNFFQKAKDAGYDSSNTEFVFYSDENDHAAEATSPTAGCDGVTTPCAYNHSNLQTTPTAGQLGEVTTNVDDDLAATPAAQFATQPYYILNDSAPDFYLYTKSGSNDTPAQPTDPNVRTFERGLGQATFNDPYLPSGNNSRPLVNQMADQTELNTLHMVTADPYRTPTVVAFAPGEDFVEGVNADQDPNRNTSNCVASDHSIDPATATCSNAAFAYQHGDYAPETFTTWAGFVGPGVANNGVDKTTWTDHVDMRATLLYLTGLTGSKGDDYTEDGRVITQLLSAPNPTLDAQATQLGLDQKELDAPVYESSEGAHDGFNTATLDADTTALKSSASNDSTYTDVTNRIATITAQRNAVVADIKGRLAAAATGTPISPAAYYNDQANTTCLLAYANALKAYAQSPTTAPAPTACSLTLPADLPETNHSALLVLAAGVALAAGLVLSGRRRARRLA